MHRYCVAYCVHISWMCRAGKRWPDRADAVGPGWSTQEWFGGSRFGCAGVTDVIHRGRLRHVEQLAGDTARRRSVYSMCEVCTLFLQQFIRWNHWINWNVLSCGLQCIDTSQEMAFPWHISFRSSTVSNTLNWITVTQYFWVVKSGNGITWQCLGNDGGYVAGRRFWKTVVLVLRMAVDCSILIPYC